jgi:hypothetical protein
VRKEARARRPAFTSPAYDVFLTYVLGSAGRQTTAAAPARWRSFEIVLDAVAGRTSR